MKLKDKVLIVTGSTTGIGRAIALKCAKEGAKVVVNGRNQERGEDVISIIGKERSLLYIGDLSMEGIPGQLVQATINAFGQIDGIVNNAALVPASNIHNTDIPFLERVFKINTFAPYTLIKEALPFLIKTKGRVLNIGSVNAYSGEPDLLAYSMSKGALTTMTRNLGDVLNRKYGVKVNQINPGWVLTENEIEKKRKDGLKKEWYKDLPKAYAPAGRLLQPEEIAAGAVFWLSEESGPISGQAFELEQFPVIGRNPPKDTSTIP